MTTTAALAATLLAYGWNPELKHTYTMNAQFDGFIPILGGNTGVVDTEMTIRVEGADSSAGHRGAVSELTAFKISFNGASLPLGLESAQEYFPKTTTQFRADGTVTKSDAPNVKPPVRLPGLDVQRFPDITYLPLILPGESVEVGAKWSFEKSFDGAPMTYDCELVRQSGTQAVIAVKVKQLQEYLENSALEPTTDTAAAQNKVKTDLTGTGTVVFDTTKGIALYVLMKNEAKSVITPIAGGETSTRDLKTTFKVTLSGYTVPADLGSGQTQAREVGWLERMTAHASVTYRWLELEIARRMPANLAPRQAWTAAFNFATRLWNSISR